MLLFLLKKFNGAVREFGLGIPRSSGYRPLAKTFAIFKLKFMIFFLDILYLEMIANVL